MSSQDSLVEASHLDELIEDLLWEKWPAAENGRFERRILDKQGIDRAVAALSTLRSRCETLERERDAYAKGCEEWQQAAADVSGEASALRAARDEAVRALQNAYVAMKIAAALPGVSEEYDFGPAIDEAARALPTPNNETLP